MLNLQLEKRLAAFCVAYVFRSYSPEAKLRAIIGQLTELAESLNTISQRDEALDAIVSFFHRTSQWHDRGLVDIITAFQANDYGQYTAVLTDLRLLETHFKNCFSKTFWCV